ncbi:MAG: zinc-binding dehydrogenase [Proteobacteria bacterium]|nr:zinc-binding dehydrogenase [Pseudomonadota bacterium]
MKKAVFYGIRDLRVEEVESPRPGPGEVKVRVRYCGICGSDLHEYLHGLFPVSPFGHEVSGEVVELGQGVDDYGIGDRVAVFAKDGYAEYMTASREALLRLPDDMSWERGAVVEPLSGAAYAIGRGRVQPSDQVLVTGAGPVGLMVLIGLKAIGVETVLVTDISKTRRDKALELGASEVLDPLEGRIPSRIKEYTLGRGVDVAVEAVGVEASLKDCLASTRYRGTVVVQGIFTDRVPIHMLGFVTREITMIGTNFIDPPRALEWMTARGATPEAMVTGIFPLDDIARGFEVLTTDKDRHIKILMAP